jgi:hypothetical protein
MGRCYYLSPGAVSRSISRITVSLLPTGDFSEDTVSGTSPRHLLHSVRPKLLEPPNTAGLYISLLLEIGNPPAGNGALTFSMLNPVLSQ